ncbi:MAG: glycosyltransferase family 39 protein [Deltaproteobacteria bacterium]|nr:glycosyltransferase family 39 protein [Deltaproteobacteria bacterium]
MLNRLRSWLGRLEPAHWVALAAALLLLPQLDRLPLLEPWERLHAGVMERMAEDGPGNAFGPVADDEFYLERPAAAYWPGALATKLLGPTSLAARLPAALAGVLLIWGVFVLVRRARGARPAALAAGVVATTPLLMVLYRTALPEALALAAGGLAALALLAAAVDAKAPRHLAWAGWGLVGLAFGLGGLPAAMPPLVAAAVFVVWSGRATAWSRLRPVSGLLATLAVAAPLCAPALAIHGPDAWRGFLRPDIAEESPASDEKIDRKKPDDRMGFDAGLEALAWGAFPWSALAPAALLGLALRRRRPGGTESAADGTAGEDGTTPTGAAAPADDEAERRGRDFEFGVLAWGVAAWGTTALLGDRFHHDPFGALLPLAVLVGLYLGRKLEGEWSVVDAVLLVAGAGLLFAFHRDVAGGPRLSLLTAYFATDHVLSLQPPAWVGRTALLGVGAAVGLALVARRWRWWLAAAAVAAALVWTLGVLHVVVPPAV